MNGLGLKRAWAGVGFVASLWSLPTVAHADPSGTVELYTWYSPARHDYFTTSDPRWKGRHSADGMKKSPDYEFVRTEGRLFDPGRPQPPGTRPLYSWWSPSRKENFTTTDPGWAGRRGDRKGGYRFVRLEGYVYEDAVAGSMPLQSFYSSGRKDNFATTDPEWTSSSKGTRRGAGYRQYRTEGYILRPAKDDAKVLRGLGYGSMPHRLIGRSQPVLVILAQHRDVIFHHGKSYYQKLFFGPRGQGTVAGWFRDASNNFFRLRDDPGIVGPMTYRNTPGTSIDESSIDCNLARRMKNRGGPFCPGATQNWELALDKAVKWAGDRGRVDFSQFDEDRNGKIENEELSIIVVMAERRWPNERDSFSFATGGVTRKLVAGCVRPRGERVKVCTDVSIVGEGAGADTIIHELQHPLMRFPDIYGSGSTRMSVAAATITGTEDNHRMYHLDPWIKMRAGWTKPVVIPVSREQPGGALELEVPAGSRREREVVFYDPDRGMNEMFLVEFRNPDARSGKYDRDVADGGMVVWWAKTNDHHHLFDLNLGGGNQGKSLFVLGAPNQRRGRSRAFDAGDGDVSLRWYRGGRSGVTVRAGEFDETSRKLTIEYWSRQRLHPRIDRVVGSSTVTAGEAITLEGEFGIDGDHRRFYLEQGSSAKELDVVSWSNRRVTLRVPGSTTAGTYELRGYGSTARKLRGNPVRVTVNVRVIHDGPRIEPKRGPRLGPGVLPPIGR